MVFVPRPPKDLNTAYMGSPAPSRFLASNELIELNTASFHAFGIPERRPKDMLYRSMRNTHCLGIYYM